MAETATETEAARLRRLSRRLKLHADPIAVQVYFVPEVKEELAALGLPANATYVCARSAAMGKVAPELIMSAWGHSRDRVVPVLAGWEVTSPEVVLAARARGAGKALRRMLGEPLAEARRVVELITKATSAAPVAGHIMFAAMRSHPTPSDPMEALWYATDTLREHRGDSHVNAWQVSGISRLELSILTELWLGRDLDRLVRMGAARDEDEVNATLASLERRGLVSGRALTSAGEAVRDDIEAATDRGEGPIINALTEAELDELSKLLAPWTKPIIDGGGVLSDPAKSVKL